MLVQIGWLLPLRKRRKPLNGLAYGVDQDTREKSRSEPVDGLIGGLLVVGIGGKNAIGMCDLAMAVPNIDDTGNIALLADGQKFFETGGGCVEEGQDQVAGIVLDDNAIGGL